jgi:hypothetical protein
MITTEQITGVFSKEHTVLVLLIIFCLYNNRNTNNVQEKLLIQQTEIKADLKIIKFRLDYEQPIKQLTLEPFSHNDQDSLICLFTNFY